MRQRTPRPRRKEAWRCVMGGGNNEMMRRTMKGGGARRPCRSRCFTWMWDIGSLRFGSPIPHAIPVERALFVAF